MTNTTAPPEIEQLRALSLPQLIAEFTELYGRPPSVRHKEYIYKKCLAKLEAERPGGESLAKQRLTELLQEFGKPAARERRTVTGKLTSAPRSQPSIIAPGTIISRIWRGKKITVEATKTGFRYERKHYRSLSAIAKDITNAHWNGRLFFNICGRKKA